VFFYKNIWRRWQNGQKFRCVKIAKNSFEKSAKSPYKNVGKKNHKSKITHVPEQRNICVYIKTSLQNCRKKSHEKIVKIPTIQHIGKFVQKSCLGRIYKNVAKPNIHIRSK
jgi:hypothetical protein